MDTIRKDGIMQNLSLDTSVVVEKGLPTVARAGLIKTQSTGLAADDLFVGITVEGNENSKDTQVRVYRKGAFTLNVAGTLAATDLGAVIYLKASGVTKTQGTGVNVKIGHIIEVISTTQASVAIDNFAGSEKAITTT